MSFRVKSSKAPGYVIMRSVRTGQPVRISVGVIPKIFWPDTWYENPYWQFSGALSKADIMEFFGDTQREIRADFAHRLATYILDYVQNMAAIVWLMNPDREGYLANMRPCIEKLSALKAKAKCRKDIMAMISVCLDYALDPF